MPVRSVLAVGDLVCTKVSGEWVTGRVSDVVLCTNVDGEWITGRVSDVVQVECFEVSLYTREGILVKNLHRQQFVKVPIEVSPRKAITLKPSADTTLKDVDLFSHDNGGGMHQVEALCGLKTSR